MKQHEVIERLKRVIEFTDDSEKEQFEVEMLHLDIMHQIFALMKQHHMKKKDVARVLGITKSQFTDLCSGDEIITLHLLIKLQRVFDVKFHMFPLYNHETIVSAAIMYKDNIYTGNSHNEIGLQMVEDKVCTRYPSGDAQGFVTSTGRYVTRKEAYIIALDAGQIKEGTTVHSTLLFSEDLR